MLHKECKKNRMVAKRGRDEGERLVVTEDKMRTGIFKFCFSPTPKKKRNITNNMSRTLLDELRTHHITTSSSKTQCKMHESDDSIHLDLSIVFSNKDNA